jgi:hypothetical protein
VGGDSTIKPDAIFDSRLFTKLSYYVDSGETSIKQNLSGGLDMNRFFTGLAVGIVGTALVAVMVFMLTPISAKGLSKDSQAIFDHVKLQCKAEAKDKNLGFLQRRKYVANCVVDALKEHPEADPYDLD